MHGFDHGSDTSSGFRDINVTRLEQGKWTPERPLHVDGWQIDACPVNGPALAAGGREDGEAERLRRQEGWQSDQARLAVASGGIAGLGWAEGTQNRAGAV